MGPYHTSLAMEMGRESRRTQQGKEARAAPRVRCTLFEICSYTRNRGVSTLANLFLP